MCIRDSYGAEYKYADPAATTNCTISGNINKEDDCFESGDGKNISVSFYDTLGYEYQVTIEVKQATDDDYSYVLNATKLTCNGKEVDLGTDTATRVANMFSNVTLSFDTVTGALTVPDGGLATLSATALGIDSLPEDVTLDFSQMTCLGTDTSFTAVRGDKDNMGAGRLVGTMSGISIQKDGVIVAAYDNGDTKIIAQIAVATFTNLSGLEKVGDNLFAQTLNSGEFKENQARDVTEDGGYFSTGVLEMSNVDLAAEFTDMITTQRGYQANSRIITVSDTMLEELINLKR